MSSSISFNYRRRIVQTSAILIFVAIFCTFCVPHVRAGLLGIAEGISELANDVLSKMIEMIDFKQYASIMLGKESKFMEAVTGPNGIGTIVMNAVKFLAGGILAVYLLVDIIKMAERGQGEIETIMIPFLKMVIAMMCIIYIDDILSGIEEFGYWFVEQMEQIVSEAIPKMMNVSKDSDSIIDKALAELSQGGGPNTEYIEAAISDGGSQASSSGIGASIFSFLKPAVDAVKSGFDSVKSDVEAGVDTIKKGWSVVKTIGSYLVAKGVQDDGGTEILSNPDILTTFTNNIAEEFWEGVPKLLTLAVFYNPLITLLSLWLKVASYAIFFELALRKAFMPIALCNLVAGNGGAASPGFRYLKRYFAIYIRMSMYLIVMAVASTMSLMCMTPGAWAVVKDGGISYQMDALGRYLFGPIVIFFAATTLFKKFGQYADEVVGAR